MPSMEDTWIVPRQLDGYATRSLWTKVDMSSGWIGIGADVARVMVIFRG